MSLDLKVARKKQLWEMRFLVRGSSKCVDLEAAGSLRSSKKSSAIFLEVGGIGVDKQGYRYLTTEDLTLSLPPFECLGKLVNLSIIQNLKLEEEKFYFITVF